MTLSMGIILLSSLSPFFGLGVPDSFTQTINVIVAQIITVEVIDRMSGIQYGVDHGDSGLKTECSMGKGGEVFCFLFLSQVSHSPYQSKKEYRLHLPTGCTSKSSLLSYINQETILSALRVAGACIIYLSALLSSFLFP